MPYRAPELFDVKTETVLDEKVDIWSLGCTLYAMAYGQSPFEVSLNDQGGSIALAVLNGQFKFPSDNRYSKEFQDLISWMLQVDPKSRPDIQQVKQDLNDKKRRERKITKCSGVTDLGTSRLAFEQGRCIFFIEKKRELYFYDVQLVSKRISHFLFVSGCTYNPQYTHAHTAQTRSLPLSLSPFVSLHSPMYLKIHVYPFIPFLAFFPMHKMLIFATHIWIFRYLNLQRPLTQRAFCLIFQNGNQMKSKEERKGTILFSTSRIYIHI